MKKVLYKKFIKLEYEIEEGSQNKKKVPGTGEWEKDFTHPGELLTWGTSYEEFENGAVQYSVALVMTPDGTVEEVLPSHIKFIITPIFNKYTPRVEFIDKNI